MTDNINGDLCTEKNGEKFKILTQEPFTDSVGRKNYIGKNVGSLPLTSGTHIFTNCMGTITGIGSATVYIVNSPGLIFDDKVITKINWQNVHRDGVAYYTFVNGELDGIISGLYSGSEVQLIPSSALTGSVYAKVQNGIASVSREIKVNRLSPSGETAYVRPIAIAPNFANARIALMQVYNGAGGVQQMYGANDFSTQTAANQLNGKSIRFAI